MVDFTLHHTSRVSRHLRCWIVLFPTLSIRKTRLTVEQKDSSKARDTARGALRVIGLFPQTLEFGVTKLRTADQAAGLEVCGFRAEVFRSSGKWKELNSQITQGSVLQDVPWVISD